MKALISVLLLTVAGVTILMAKGGPPINDVCPVKGNAIRLIFRIFTDKGTVAFCCADCMDAYQKNPGRYTVKPKAEK